MENYTENPVASPASLLFVGLGWFPQSPGGVERYVYDLTRHLTEAKVPWSKIQIIRAGVDLTRFQPNLFRQEARTQLNWSQDCAILFTPRRLVHRRSVYNLLHSLYKLKKLLKKYFFPETI